MKRNRRRFLSYLLAGTGSTLAGAGYWISTSNRRAARYLRQIYVDSKRTIAPAPFTPNPAAWSDNKITLCWIGHATVLINFFGVKILTDPALGNRIGISLGLGTAGPKRFIRPALGFKALPAIDVLLLSHAHMDHMDVPTLRRFSGQTFTVTADLTRDVLRQAGLENITELRWGEQVTFRSPNGSLELEAVEVQHWGQRWPSELVRGYNGYILRREGQALLFGGDTANTSLIPELHSRGPFAAAIMPIGAYRPWIRNHCTPEQAVDMARRAGARYLVPVHHQTFRLSEEPLNEPVERCQAALSDEPERLALRQVGETFVCPAG